MFPSAQPAIVVIDLAKILDTYHAELTREVLEGRLGQKDISGFEHVLDDAIRSIVAELTIQDHRLVIAKQAIWSQAPDITLDVLAWLRARYPNISALLPAADPSKTTSSIQPRTLDPAVEQQAEERTP